MSERLRPRDLAFLAAESPHDAACTTRRSRSSTRATPASTTTGWSQLIADRISFVPRYRQRVQLVPGRLANPVWVDDDALRPRLPRTPLRAAAPGHASTSCASWWPGSCPGRSTGTARCGRSTSSRGSRAAGSRCSPRPTRCWSTASRPSTSARCCSTRTPEPRTLGARRLAPAPAPVAAGLVAGAVHDTLDRPGTVLDTVRADAGRRRCGAADAAAARVGAVAGALAGRRPGRGDARCPASSPSSAGWSRCAPTLADYRTIREAHGGTVNDVILATVTGALRGWLMTRAESMGGLQADPGGGARSRSSTSELEATSLGSQIAAHFVNLPIGEASPVVRLHQVSYSFQAHKETGRGGRRQPARRDRRLRADDLPRDRLAGGRGRAAPRLPARDHQRARAAVAAVRRRRADGRDLSRARRCCPDHALAIGVTSYDGRVFYGITADRDLVPDADVLGQCVPEALDELLDTAEPAAGPQIPRGRAEEGAAAEGGAVTRVYLPTTLAGLAALAADGLAARRRRAGTSPTDDDRGGGVRRADGGRGRLGRAAGPAPGRRVVVVAEVGDARRRRCRCATSSPSTPTPGPPADADPDDDLAWYATQEIDDLLAWSSEPLRRSADASAHGRDHLPAGSRQRAEPDLRPRQPRAGGAARRSSTKLERQQHDLRAHIGGRAQGRRRRRDQGRPAARPPARAGHLEELDARPTPRRRSRPPPTPRPAGGRCPSTSGARSCSRPPTCSPARGASGSTPRPCSASRRRRSRPRSTAPAS